jgi:hypothetical protein
VQDALFDDDLEATRLAPQPLSRRSSVAPAQWNPSRSAQWLLDANRPPSGVTVAGHLVSPTNKRHEVILRSVLRSLSAPVAPKPLRKASRVERLGAWIERWCTKPRVLVVLATLFVLAALTFNAIAHTPQQRSRADVAITLTAADSDPPPAPVAPPARTQSVAVVEIPAPAPPPAAENRTVQHEKHERKASRARWKPLEARLLFGSKDL